MGEDPDIVTLSFAVKGDAAKDLVKFIETGYDFVLDADKIREQSDGKYRVFVEIERLNNQLEILDGVKKISNKKIYVLDITKTLEVICR